MLYHVDLIVKTLTRSLYWNYMIKQPYYFTSMHMHDCVAALASPVVPWRIDGIHPTETQWAIRGHHTGPIYTAKK